MPLGPLSTMSEWLWLKGQDGGVVEGRYMLQWAVALSKREGEAIDWNMTLISLITIFNLKC